MAKTAFVMDQKSELSFLVDELGDIKHKLDGLKEDYEDKHFEISKKCKNGRILGHKKWKALIYTTAAERMDIAVVKQLLQKYVPAKLRAKAFKTGKPSTVICITSIKSPKWKGK